MKPAFESPSSRTSAAADAASVAEPWPLATAATFRLVAWPRYDEPTDLAALADAFGGLELPAAGVCLCLRHDPEHDGDVGEAIRRAEQLLMPLGTMRGLEVLVVDDPIPASDWPRLGRAASCALRLPSSAAGVRRAFLEEVGTDVIPLFHVPRQRNDIRPQIALMRLFAGPGAADERLQRVDEIIQRAPWCRPALAVRGELLVSVGRHQEAARDLRTCLALGYDDVGVQGLFQEATGCRGPLRAHDGRFCSMPFTDFEILDGGDVYLCSNVNLPFPVGNVDSATWQDIWNSPAAQEIRRSILDGDFSYCAPMTCPLQHGLPHRDAVGPDDRRFIDERTLVVDTAPRRVALAYDRSCNLRCPSCRTHGIMASKAEAQRFDQIAERVVLPLLENASVAHITGSGDPFASPHYRRLLAALSRDRFPGLAIDMMTNGMLLDATVWDIELRHLHGRMREVAVSLDGATAETYERLRPGGSFDTVCANLAHLAHARRSGALLGLAVNMVVQECNFREMADLVRMCREWGVDQVRFYKLRQWGTYAADDFLRRDVVNPQHPRHGELLECLRDPVFAQPIVVPFELGHLITSRSSPIRSTSAAR